MTLLLRPRFGRLAGGVAAAFASRYDLNVGAVRLLILCLFLASPIAPLVYLVFWASIPEEQDVISRLRLKRSGMSGRSDRFAEFSGIMIARLRLLHRTYSDSKIWVAFGLLFLSSLLMLVHIQGGDFYALHPLISLPLGVLERISGSLAFFALALVFWLPPQAEAPVELRLSAFDKLALDHGANHQVFGLMSGLGRTIAIDPAYLRVLAIFVSLLTFGIASAVYGVTAYVLSKRGQIEGTDNQTNEPRFAKAAQRIPSTRIIVGGLLALLAGVRLATEYRLFFFNEPFVTGIIILSAGAVYTYQALRMMQQNDERSVWLWLGPVVAMYGIYELSTSIFGVQLPFTGRFEVAYLIVATSLIYYALIALDSNRRVAAVAIGVLLYAMSVLVQFNLISAEYLLRLSQFYAFFFPIIFSASGLWLVLEE